MGRFAQRAAIGGLRPGTLIPGGTATHFDRPADEAAEQMRIHLPDDRSQRTASPSAVQAPKPSQRSGDPPAYGRIPTARRDAPGAPTPASEPAPPDGARVPAAREPFAVSIAGLASAAVVAEGVLHADPPERPWALPSMELLEEGSAARTGLVTVVGDGPFFERPLRLAEGLWTALQGIDAWPGALRPLTVDPDAPGSMRWPASGANPASCC